MEGQDPSHFTSEPFAGSTPLGDAETDAEAPLSKKQKKAHKKQRQSEHERGFNNGLHTMIKLT